MTILQEQWVMFIIIGLLHEGTSVSLVTLLGLILKFWHIISTDFDLQHLKKNSTHMWYIMIIYWFDSRPFTKLHSPRGFLPYFHQSMVPPLLLAAVAWYFLTCWWFLHARFKKRCCIPLTLSQWMCSPALISTLKTCKHCKSPNLVTDKDYDPGLWTVASTNDFFNFRMSSFRFRRPGGHWVVANAVA